MKPGLRQADISLTNPSAREQRFGELMFLRATDQSPEMECAKAACRLLEPRYRPGMSVLDVGCGAGHYLLSLQRRLDPRIDYYGIDASAHYIKLARDAFENPARFRVGTVTELPYADSSIDIVMCINVLPNLPPPPRAALAELLRVARHAVLIRTLFADVNYLIQEFETTNPNDAETIDVSGQPAPGIATHNNIYSEQYLRNVLRSIDPSLAPVIQPDTHQQEFASDHPAGTRIINNREVAGALLLDWRFITIPLQDAKA